MESWSIQQGRGKVTWKREVVRGYSISMDRGEKVRETLGARVLREVCQAYRYLERELRNIRNYTEAANVPPNKPAFSIRSIRELVAMDSNER